MQKHLFKYESFLPFSGEDVFAWHMREGALDRMIPPWVNTQINKRGRPDVVGSKTVFHFSLGPYHTDWVSEHTSFTPHREFVDEQRKGPFRYFRHTHKVEEVEGGCILKDIVEYGRIDPKKEKFKTKKEFFYFFLKNNDFFFYLKLFNLKL
jgi:ligand-binding SRPBCC domain-containing protein